MIQRPFWLASVMRLGLVLREQNCKSLETVFFLDRVNIIINESCAISIIYEKNPVVKTVEVKSHTFKLYIENVYQRSRCSTLIHIFGFGRSMSFTFWFSTSLFRDGLSKPSDILHQSRVYKNCRTGFYSTLIEPD